MSFLELFKQYEDIANAIKVEGEEGKKIAAIYKTYKSDWTKIQASILPKVKANTPLTAQEVALVDGTRMNGKIIIRDIPKLGPIPKKQFTDRKVIEEVTKINLEALAPLEKTPAYLSGKKEQKEKSSTEGLLRAEATALLPKADQAILGMEAAMHKQQCPSEKNLLAVDKLRRELHTLLAKVRATNNLTTLDQQEIAPRLTKLDRLIGDVKKLSVSATGEGKLSSEMELKSRFASFYTMATTELPAMKSLVDSKTGLMEGHLLRLKTLCKDAQTLATEIAATKSLATFYKKEVQPFIGGLLKFAQRAEEIPTMEATAQKTTQEVKLRAKALEIQSRALVFDATVLTQRVASPYGIELSELNTINKIQAEINAVLKEAQTNTLLQAFIERELNPIVQKVQKFAQKANALPKVGDAPIFGTSILPADVQATINEIAQVRAKIDTIRRELGL